MFTAKELTQIDRRYFCVLDREEDIIVLKSKNTGHCWHLHKPYDNRSDCVIWHRHENQTEYHRHKCVKSLEEAVRVIKSHDLYQINVRWSKK